MKVRGKASYYQCLYFDAGRKQNVSASLAQGRETLGNRMPSVGYSALEKPRVFGTTCKSGFLSWYISGSIDAVNDIRSALLEHPRG